MGVLSLLVAFSWYLAALPAVWPIVVMALVCVIGRRIVVVRFDDLDGDADGHVHAFVIRFGR
jgi:1,4-dihydroxy-2-naphthoate octaprenyltransferase